MRWLAAVPALGLVLGAGTAEAAVQCPAAQDGHGLRRVSVFDGPPAEGVDLRPDARGRKDIWSGLDATGRPAYLVCRYDSTSRSIEILLPKGTRTCEGIRRADDTYGGVTCR